MIRLTTFFPALFVYGLSYGQPVKSIGISVTGRYDRHADYISNFGGRAYSDTNKIYGFSYGINAVFKQQIHRSSSIYIGIGYYHLSVDKIKGPIPFNTPGIRTARNIDYSDGMTNLLYSTTQYHYNNLAIILGLDKEFLLNHKFKLNISAEAIGYMTVSQKYRLSSSKYYTTHNSKPLEFGVNINTGIIKEYRRFYLNPSLIIPVFQNLKGDKVFYEDKKMNISTWFNGIGLSLKIGRYI